MDGVLIDDETIWMEKEKLMYPKVLGPEVAAKLGNTVGTSMDGIYELAIAAGSDVSKQELVDSFHTLAADIYRTAPITEGVDNLARLLKQLGYRIGIVSASPMAWITPTVNRLSFRNDIELIVSLAERQDLGHKPEPDGYLEAIKFFHASPASTIILEDSNSGIKSAKAAGAYTIALRQNLTEGYKQEGADAYADTIEDVMALVRQRSA